MVTSSHLKVLDKGYVRITDVQGTDLSVVNAARVSYKKASTFHVTNAPDEVWGFLNDFVSDDWRPHIIDALVHAGVVDAVLRERDTKLLRYLAEHNHWSPFSHAGISFEIRAPIFVVNQIYKHRIGSQFTMDDPWNEQSGRYVKDEFEFYNPWEWREWDSKNKQGSQNAIHGAYKRIIDGIHGETIMAGIKAYEILTKDFKVAPEMARLVLPYAGMYTTLRWSMTLARLFTFAELRNKPDAQLETQQYARAIIELAKPLFPGSFEAWGM